MASRVIDPDDFDRVEKLLVDAGQAPTFDAARALLETYRLQIAIGVDACADPAWQAAALTAVNAGARAVHGGVRVLLGRDERCRVPIAYGRRLSAALAAYGATLVEELEPDVPTIAFGHRAVSGLDAPTVHTSASTWTARVTAGAGTADEPEAGSASVTAAVMSAALAVSECFQRLRGHVVAADRSFGVSLWRPDRDVEDPLAEGPPITELPASLWLLGLGHLGQGYAWLLGLLPYPLKGARALGLQDDDRLSHANRATSMLHLGQHIGVRKTRLVGGTLERLGWDTRLVEHRYLGGPLRGDADPATLLVGVDNVQARRLLDQTQFPEIVDVGLGAGPDGFLGITVRRLPGRRSSQETWTAAAPRAVGPPRGAERAYRALEQHSGDRCGVEQLAGRTVATAFVGVTAACWAIGGLLRELHGGARLELLDHTLREPAAVTALAASDTRPPRVPTVAAVEL